MLKPVLFFGVLAEPYLTNAFSVTNSPVIGKFYSEREVRLELGKDWEVGEDGEGYINAGLN